MLNATKGQLTFALAIVKNKREKHHELLWLRLAREKLKCGVKEEAVSEHPLQTASPPRWKTIYLALLSFRCWLTSWGY